MQTISHEDANQLVQIKLLMKMVLKLMSSLMLMTQQKDVSSSAQIIQGFMELIKLTDAKKPVHL